MDTALNSFHHRSQIRLFLNSWVKFLSVRQFTYAYTYASCFILKPLIIIFFSTLRISDNVFLSGVILSF